MSAKHGKGPHSPRHAVALSQPTLFRSSREQLIARTSVSVDEMVGWHRKGWLSFDPADIGEFDEKEFLEVLFIKALARFGLSDAMVDRLLVGLEKPYCYDPTTGYSFVEQAWIALPLERDPGDVTQEYINSLIKSEEWDTLWDLREQISDAISQK